MSSSTRCVGSGPTLVSSSAGGSLPSRPRKEAAQEAARPSEL